ncbi:MAG TPA: DUF58 domain-containing protein, partial [Polyangiales bacterium]|nr:DUF58 domain-containing protein [Polyangiales bacterium]
MTSDARELFGRAKQPAALGDQRKRNADDHLLDQKLVDRISGLRVRARRAVDGIRSGVHKSPHRGASMIFAEHRDYRPGDDLRMLDWRAYARNDRYTVKRFEQETHLRGSLLLDVSTSMDYDGGRPETRKSEIAATLLAALGLLLLGQGDAVGAYAFDSELRKVLPPRNRPDHLDALLGVLELPPRAASEGGAAKLGAALQNVGERIGRRGLVALASDLLDLDDSALRPLSQFSALGHEVIVFHTLHPDELEFPWKHSVRFEDAESPEVLETDADAVRRGYQAELQRF